MGIVATCTWLNCTRPAAHPIRATDGEVWANLCDEHDAEMTRHIVECDGQAILRDWVRAGGGAKKMVERMFR